jgi:hypothetical protein
MANDWVSEKLEQLEYADWEQKLLEEFTDGEAKELEWDGIDEKWLKSLYVNNLTPAEAAQEIRLELFI